MLAFISEKYVSGGVPVCRTLGDSTGNWPLCGGNCPCYDFQHAMFEPVGNPVGDMGLYSRFISVFYYARVESCVRSFGQVE